MRAAAPLGAYVRVCTKDLERARDKYLSPVASILPSLTWSLFPYAPMRLPKSSVQNKSDVRSHKCTVAMATVAAVTSMKPHARSCCAHA